jgi:hypothetical protein
MTSWHDQEPLQDIAEFFVLNTSFDFFKPSAFVIVAIGDDAEYNRRRPSCTGFCNPTKQSSRRGETNEPSSCLISRRSSLSSLGVS